MRLGGLFQPPHFGDLSYVFSDLKNGKFFNRPFVGIGLCDNGPSTVSVRCTNLFEWIRLPVTHAIVLWQSGIRTTGIVPEPERQFWLPLLSAKQLSCSGCVSAPTSDELRRWLSARCGECQPELLSESIRKRPFHQFASSFIASPLAFGTLFDGALHWRTFYASSMSAP